MVDSKARHQSAINSSSYLVPLSHSLQWVPYRLCLLLFEVGLDLSVETVGVSGIKQASDHFDRPPVRLEVRLPAPRSH